jgi:hypothetical protein
MAGTRPAMTIRGLNGRQLMIAESGDRAPVLVGYPTNHPAIFMAGVVPAIHGFLACWQRRLSEVQ